MGRSRELHVIEPQDLLRDGLSQLGSAVAVEVHPPGGDHVEVLAACCIPEHGPLSPDDREGLSSLPVLGEGVPHCRPVTIQEIAVQKICLGINQSNDISPESAWIWKR